MKQARKLKPVVATRDCVSCGDEIPEARMKALPQTTICVDCAQQRESRGQFHRSVMDIQPEIESWENIGVTQTLVKGTQV